MRIIRYAVLLAVTVGSSLAAAQSGNWRVDASATDGPLAQLNLPDSRGKKRAVLIAFEYARRCDPIFSFAELVGSRPGVLKSQSVLTGSKIGVVLNGAFYTWHAAQTIYDNGYEAGFGLPNDLVLKMLLKIDTLEYVTPSGERVPLSTRNFDTAFREAFDICRKRVR